MGDGFVPDVWRTGPAAHRRFRARQISSEGHFLAHSTVTKS
jgi:hypothetical protein